MYIKEIQGSASITKRSTNATVVRFRSILPTVMFKLLKECSPRNLRTYSGLAAQGAAPPELSDGGELRTPSPLHLGRCASHRCTWELRPQTSAVTSLLDYVPHSSIFTGSYQRILTGGTKYSISIATAVVWGQSHQVQGAERAAPQGTRSPRAHPRRVQGVQKTTLFNRRAL